jgi:hypothetical protein
MPRLAGLTQTPREFLMSGSDMSRILLAATALLASGLAHAQIVLLNGSAASQPGEVRLKWSPLDWETAVTGMEVRRRSGEGEWVTLGRTNIPAQFQARWLRPYIEGNGIESALVTYASASEAGFAFIDKTPPAEPPGGKVIYALHALANGAVNEDAAKYFEWQIGQHEPIAMPFEHVGNQLSANEALVIFETNPTSLAAMYTAGYRIFEERRGKRTDVGRGLREPIRGSRNPPHLCLRPKKPYPDAIILQAENSFGFTSELLATLDTRQPDKSARDPVSPDCGRPVVSSINSDSVAPPPPPPPAPVSRPATPEKKLLQGAVLHLDVNKALRVVNGKVFKWPDVTANGNDASMADVERQPAYYGGYSGRVVSMTGDKWLQLARPLASPKFTVFLVLSDDKPFSKDFRTIIGGSAGHQTSFVAFAGRDALVVASHDGKELARTTLKNKRDMVLALRFDGRSLSVWQNDMAAAPMKLPAKTAFSFDALGSHDTRSPMDGKLRAVIAFDQSLDEGRITQILQLLRHDFRMPNY